MQVLLRRVVGPLFTLQTLSGISCLQPSTSVGQGMPRKYSSEIRKFVESFEISQRKPWTSGSLRVHHVNLTTPVMRDYVKEFQRHHDLTYDEWESTLDDLYRKTTTNFEEVCIAGYMLGQYPKHRKQLPLSLLSSWIENLQGWAEIDVTCQSNFSSQEVAARWDDGFRVFLTHDLVQSPLVSHQRASLVLLLRTMRESNNERFLLAALGNVDHLTKGQHKDDKLITKAISWVLRTAIKQHREQVKAYVEMNVASLPAIAVREFRKKYTTGTK